MNDGVAAPTYAGYRFPAEIIAHAVWFYSRFALSDRDAEGLLAEHGVVVTYGTIRRWSRKLGQAYANTLRHRRPLPGDKWLYWLVGVSVRESRGPHAGNTPPRPAPDHRRR